MAKIKKKSKKVVPFYKAEKVPVLLQPVESEVSIKIRDMKHK